MSMKNWVINNIPINQLNTIVEVLPNEDCCIFSYKILNRGSGNANILFALTNNMLSALTPTGLSVSNEGLSGTTTYSYRITVVNSRGESTPCNSVITETGNSILSEINFNRLTWTAVTGAIAYRIYGRTLGSEKFIGEVDGNTTTFDDIGLNTPTFYPPSINTTHLKFRFVQDTLSSNEMINSDQERFALMPGDRLQIFSDNPYIDIIVFGDLIPVVSN